MNNRSEIRRCPAGGARRALAVASLALACLRPAGAGDRGAETRYPIMGRIWSESQLRAAYEKVWRLYAVDKDSRMILPAPQRNGLLIQGKIREKDSGRRVIIESGIGRVAVRCGDVMPGEPGDTVELMVCPSGTPLMSYESGPDTRESLRQYVDATLYFGDFVASLQRGQHYPEIPELGTRAERKGLFRTERVRRNVIEDR